MQDARLNDRLIKYWESCRKDNNLPDITHFNISVVQDLWERCLRVRVVRTGAKPAEFHYEYVGEAIVKAYGRDLNGYMVQAKFSKFPGTPIIKRIHAMLDTPQVIEDFGQFASESNKIIKYRACLLPFKTNEKGITHVIVGLSWREF